VPAFCYHFLLLLPILIHELRHNGRLHKAWLAGLALYLPCVVLTCLLWNQPAWQQLAGTLLGY
jgi:hypothetical protein